MLFKSNSFFVLNKGREPESGFEGKNIWCSGYGRSIHTDNICSNQVCTKPEENIFIWKRILTIHTQLPVLRLDRGTEEIFCPTC